MNVSLPEEILVIIVGYLQLPEVHAIAQQLEDHSDADDPASPVNVLTSLATLRAVSLASKALYRIAEPVLYSVYPGRDFVHPYRFLRAILATETRALLVKEFTYGGFDEPLSDWIYCYDDDNMERPTSTHIRSRIEQSLLSEKCTRKIASHASQGGSQGSLDTLMLSCPNIEVLEIMINSFGDVSELLLDGWSPARSMPSAGKRPQTFDRLRSLSLWKGVDGVFEIGDDRVLSRLAPILDRPQLLSLAMHDMAFIELDHGLQWPNVQEITLYECPISGSDGLEDILKSCPRLKSLKMLSTAGEMFIDIEEMGSALNTFGGSIEELVLHAGDDTFDWEPVFGDREEANGDPFGIGTIVNMARLHSLTATPWILVGSEGRNRLHEILPCGLQTLTLLPTLNEEFAPDVGADIDALRTPPKFEALNNVTWGSFLGFPGFSCNNVAGWTEDITTLDEVCWHTSRRVKEQARGVEPRKVEEAR